MKENRDGFVQGDVLILIKYRPKEKKYGNAPKNF